MQIEQQRKKQKSQYMRPLNDLLVEFIPHSMPYAQLVCGLTLDSRRVNPGDIFFAYCGHNIDSRKYIEEAIAKGAVAVVCDEGGDSDNSGDGGDGGDICSVSFNDKQHMLVGGVPVFVVSRSCLRYLIGAIAAKFYAYPSRAMQIIGVTGTNGKSSCTHFIAKLLCHLGYPCGVIGTLGAGFPDALTPLNNTTPDAITIQRFLALLRDQGARAVAMEVSSHSLAQRRVEGVEFDSAVFTNLTHDHLDYHGDMKKYAQVKKRLFFKTNIKHAVINIDDSCGRDLLRELQHVRNTVAQLPRINVCAYTLGEAVVSENGIAKITASNLVTDIHGVTATLTTPWGNGTLRSQLLGKFNVSNLLVAIAVLGNMGFALDAILTAIASLQPLTGRMQTFGGGGLLPLVVVDYAHTPDALENALLVLREHCQSHQGKLWCVFGCGGGRDSGKRPIMGRIAELYGDNIVVTSDNPRTENPQSIIDAVVAGMLCPWAVEVEADRLSAITHALDCAQVGDIVLIAGKGHENYQIIGNEKIPFSDISIVQALLQSKLRR